MFVFWQFLQYAFPVVVKDHCIFHMKPYRTFYLSLYICIYGFCLLSFIIHSNVIEMTAFVVFKDFIRLWMLPLETLFFSCGIIHIRYITSCYIPCKGKIFKVPPDPPWFLLHAFHPHPLFAIYLNFVHHMPWTVLILCLPQGSCDWRWASRWHHHTNNQLYRIGFHYRALI